ncbi:Uncharacterised protein [Achromobacter xylosoxidans]|nr:Uncharacterised protein [Achromobacter xylosoxidans]
MRSSSSFCFVMVWTNWFSSMFMAGSLSKEWLRRNTHSKDLEPAAHTGALAYDGASYV